MTKYLFDPRSLGIGKLVDCREDMAAELLPGYVEITAAEHAAQAERINQAYLSWANDGVSQTQMLADLRIKSAELISRYGP